MFNCPLVRYMWCLSMEAINKRTITYYLEVIVFVADSKWFRAIPWKMARSNRMNKLQIRLGLKMSSVCIGQTCWCWYLKVVGSTRVDTSRVRLRVWGDCLEMELDLSEKKTHLRVYSCTQSGGGAVAVEDGCLVSNFGNDSTWSMKSWRHCSGGGSGVFPLLSVPGNWILF
jgi:hypothetical protein